MHTESVCPTGKGGRPFLILEEMNLILLGVPQSTVSIIFKGSTIRLKGKSNGKMLRLH
jgi:hypothetical protein